VSRQTIVTLSRISAPRGGGVRARRKLVTGREEA
jgi:hypothetical protein